MDAASVSAVLRQHGEPMNLARAGVSPDVTIYAKRFSFAGSNLEGDIQQGERGFKFTDSDIAAAGWPGPPRKFDQITTSDGLIYVVQSVDTRSDGAVVLMHICRAKGDA